MPAHRRQIIPLDSVSWLSFILLPRLPGSFQEPVTFRGFVPITVAGPPRILTGFPLVITRGYSLFDCR